MSTFKKEYPNITFMSYKNLVRYNESIVNFFKKAADSHVKLSFIKELSFIKDGTLHGIMSPNMMIQLFTIYIMVKDLQNPIYRQMIRPDALMLEYLDDQIRETLEEQQKIYDGSGDLYKSDSFFYPGLIRFPYIQVMSSKCIIKSYHEDEKMKSLLTSEKNKNIITSETNTLRNYRRELLGTNPEDDEDEDEKENEKIYEKYEISIENAEKHLHICLQCDTDLHETYCEEFKKLYDIYEDLGQKC